MKKLILFFSAVYLLSLGAFAQTLVMTDGVTDFANGDTIAIAKPAVYVDSTIVAHIYAKNLTGNAFDVVCRRYNDDVVTGSENLFCFGIGCYPPFVDLSQPAEIKGGEKLEIKGEYSALGNVGASIIRYSVYDPNNMGDSTWVYVVFNPSSAVGIEAPEEKIEVSKAFPNPANDFVNIDYTLKADVGEVRFVINDVLGSTVKSVQLTETSGRITTMIDDLQNGVYFYSFVTENEILVTRKLVVRR